VKGHSDDATNIRVDELAVAAMQPYKGTKLAAR
jgi:ribonuclease HI